MTNDDFREDNSIMTTMVMSSAIKAPDTVIDRKLRNRGKVSKDEDMQWVFLTTTKRRMSAEEQKLIRVDSKNTTKGMNDSPFKLNFTRKHNATCLRDRAEQEGDLKEKYGQKWLRKTKNVKVEGSLSEKYGRKWIRKAHSTKDDKQSSPSLINMKKQNRFASLRLPLGRHIVNKSPSNTTLDHDSGNDINTVALRVEGKYKIAQCNFRNAY